MIFTPRSQSDKGLVGDFKKTYGDVEILYGFEISKQMTQVLKLEGTNVRHRPRFCELKKGLQSSSFHTSLHKYIKIIYLRNKNVFKLYF